jgi:hypothetical protein
LAAEPALSLSECRRHFMTKVEIIPPNRPVAPRSDRGATSVVPPRLNPGGLLSSTLIRWEANRHARVISAVAERVRAEANLFDAQTQALESYAKRQRVAARVQELPEIIANDRAVRKIEQAEELRQVQHRHETAEKQRKAEVTHADRVLLDARQALKAQREHGYDSYALEWKKRNCEILDVELSMAERKAVLREHMGQFEESSAPRGIRPGAGDDEVDGALHEARSQLRASGLDTSKIDAVLSRRNGKGTT